MALPLGAEAEACATDGVVAELAIAARSDRGARGRCGMLRFTLPPAELSRINENETSGIPRVRGVDRPGNLLASVLLEPVHAAAACEVLHTLLVRDRRNPFVGADNVRGGRRGVAVSQRDSLRVSGSVIMSRYWELCVSRGRLANTRNLVRDVVRSAGTWHWRYGDVRAQISTREQADRP